LAVAAGFVLALEENDMKDVGDVVGLPEMEAVDEAEVRGGAAPEDSQKSLHCPELPHLQSAFRVIGLVHSLLSLVVRHCHHINIQTSQDKHCLKSNG